MLKKQSEQNDRKSKEQEEKIILGQIEKEEPLSDSNLDQKHL